MKTPYWFLAALAVSALIVAACGDDDDSAPAAPADATNIQVVDSAVKAALAGDAAALTALTRPQSQACQMIPSGPIPAQPKCIGSQTEGTMVQAVLMASGSGGWRQVSELPEVWPNWFGPSRELYAVKKLEKADVLSGAIYHVVFVRADGAGTSLRMSADGIVGIGFDPSFNPRQQADGPAGTFIIPPK